MSHVASARVTVAFTRRSLSMWFRRTLRHGAQHRRQRLRVNHVRNRFRCGGKPVIHPRLHKPEPAGDAEQQSHIGKTGVCPVGLRAGLPIAVIENDGDESALELRIGFQAQQNPDAILVVCCVLANTGDDRLKIGPQRGLERRGDCVVQPCERLVFNIRDQILDVVVIAVKR